MPLELFRSTQFSAANAVTFAVYGGLGGALFLVPVALQEVKGYSPLEAGASLLPVTLLMLLLSARSGALWRPGSVRASRCRLARSWSAPVWPCSPERPEQGAT